ncbi:MAG: ABC transporter substrate-binding protein [Actinomycetaceae bacterium]|nr:ABC transporter substrate-binding protein [Actinomycetaceae bacterium]MDY6083175.1 ABC transporter substrate-binding protein [Actinomycetaceae bacterium]
MKTTYRDDTARTRSRLLILLTALLASVMLVLSGCSSASKSSASGASTTPSASVSNKKLTVGLTYIPDIQFAPFYVGVEKGFFADAGVDVSLRHHGAQESLFGALQAGNEDVVYAGGDEMMAARSNDVDVRDWATLYQRYPVVLIVRADSPITSPRDLVGKSVGVPGKEGETYMGLQAMLNEYSIADSVDVQFIGYTQAAALTSKKVDAVIGFENSQVPALKASGVDVRAIPLSEHQLPLVGVGLGSLSGTVEKNSAAFTALLSGLDKATAWARDHISETVELSKKYVPSLADAEQAKQAQAVLENTLDLMQGEGNKPLGYQNADQWNAMADFMEKNGFTATRVESNTAFIDMTKQNSSN